MNMFFDLVLDKSIGCGKEHLDTAADAALGLKQKQDILTTQLLMSERGHTIKVVRG